MSQFTVNATVNAASITEAWEIVTRIPGSFKPEEDWSDFASFALFDANTDGSRVYLSPAGAE